jgi:ribose transport system ATP-binding protein
VPDFTDPMSNMSEPGKPAVSSTISLSAQGVQKRYGGVVALADGNLEVQGGEVVALLGANGSGKSTLSKIITGVVSPNAGQLLVDGKPTHFASPQAAKKIGVTAVYQETSLIPDMTVAENIWLAHEPRRLFSVNRREMRRRTQALLDLFSGVIRKSLTPDASIADLPPDERQIVEILKALSLKPRLVILDEATASLDSQQVNRLFELVSTWKQQGMAIVFVSHRMEEIFRVADRATVLRSGQTVGSARVQDVKPRELVAMMVEGAALPEHTPSTLPADAPVRLRVNNLRSDVLKGLSFELHDGELLGIGGLQGQGQSDLLMALYGAEAYEGEITLSGQPVHFRHPREAMRQEVALVPGDRGGEGLLLIRSILENLQLPSWHRYGTPIRLDQARKDGKEIAQDLRLVMSSLDAPVSTLSGGNAQKVVIGKWLLRKPKLLLLDDPTKGVDVGAKGEFYTLLHQLQEAGTAILFYSSDDEELLGLCDRVLVLQDGELRAELAGNMLNQSNLVAASMGTEHAS